VIIAQGEHCVKETSYSVPALKKMLYLRSYYQFAKKGYSGNYLLSPKND